MTRGPLGPVHEEFLSRLEREELKWLSWGQVDASLSDAEVRAAADTVLAQHAGAQSARELVDDLLDFHLLIDLGDEPPRYRTRFAESVRLLARLRQLTPSRGFRQAPELVNDFRVLARPRTFPRREFDFEDAVKFLEDDAPVETSEHSALQAMLGGGGTPLLLSRFQLEAARRIRREMLKGGLSATIVSAGTGSGKTKAFYLPVLARIAADGAADRWARILAIYPRNELLKDQLAEALSQVELIAAGGGPVMGVGALFGPTPWSAEQAKRDARSTGRGWLEAPGGLACRYIRCPKGCPDDLVWRTADLQRQDEVLECPTCSWRSRPGQLTVTRESIKANTPHILFTTTEMLNRGLADAELRRTFVGDTGRRPSVLLLDEVHTYGGTHGAQVALLLRRWRHALGRAAPLHVVGLSATLENPSEFMAKIAGLPDVQEIAPREDDLEQRSAEYALVLRGNPVSGTALLSTTIQATFLLARLLEARSLRDQTGTSGNKVFAFTDDLDVTNRLYWSIQSAEGIYTGRQAPPLAALRRRAGARDPEAMDADGQIWDICPQLGHQLGDANRLSIARTSSQDAGVDPQAEVIVATSSLEVGFDDPEVGAVIQHKAPRDDAAFLQRKGRAGRTQSMRPWTVVVLSDYGRDRVRYQGYETLFAPRLSARSIPVDNLHLLKMQSAYALLDWLCLNVPGLRARGDLSQPVTQQTTWEQRRMDRQAKAAALLEQVLTDPRREREFARHLRQALELSDEQLEAVMWESPRALITSAIPMMLRRLRAKWTTPTKRIDRFVRDVPLPEHAPQALFSDLNLPEVNIVAPARRPVDSPLETAMPIVQALSEFAPGRASRRFGVSSYTTWHWVPIPEDTSSGATVDVDTFVPVTEDAGALQVRGEASQRPLLRPWRIELALADRQEQQSNARAIWKTQITASSRSWDLQLPAGSPAAAAVQLQFHTAALGNEVELARGVVGSVVSSADSEAEVGLGRTVDGTQQPVALGFRAPVDAICLSLRRDELPSFDALSNEARRAVLGSWFEHQVATDLALRTKASQFSLGWLSSLYVAALAGGAVSNPQAVPDLRSAVDFVDAEGLSRCLERALDAVFVADQGEPEQDDTRAMARLRTLINDPNVASRLSELGNRLAGASASDLGAWLPRMIATSAAVAFREAFQRLCPDADGDSLVLEIDAAVDPPPTAEAIDVWLVEPDVGSGGTVEEIRRTASADPGRLGRLLSASLAPTDYEVIDWGVREALIVAQTNGELASAFADVRDARTGAETTAALRRLRQSLRAGGISADHGVMSSLNLRVLRPGSSSATDAALLTALDLWDAAEGQLGIELDGRSIAYAASRQPGAKLTLEQVYSLLWPRGRAARSAGRSPYSRFADLPPADPLLLRDSMRESLTELVLSDGDLSAVIAEARDVLARTGVVRIRVPAGRATDLQALILRVIDAHIEVGSVIAYPRATGAGQSPDGPWATVELAEAIS